MRGASRPGVRDQGSGVRDWQRDPPRRVPIHPCYREEFMGMEWTPESWRALPALQRAEYPDPAALERVLCELRQLPPLVTSWEIQAL